MGKKKSGRVLPLLFGALAALTTAFIWYNSIRVGADSDAVSLGVMGALNQGLAGLGLEGLFSNHLVRKLGHLLEFLLLGFLLSLCLQTATRRRWQYLCLPLAGGLAVAAVDEVIQLYVPGRSGQVSDVLLDFIGVVLGTGLGLLVGWLIRRARRKKQLK